MSAGEKNLTSLDSSRLRSMYKMAISLDSSRPRDVCDASVGSTPNGIRRRQVGGSHQRTPRCSEHVTRAFWVR